MILKNNSLLSEYCDLGDKRLNRRFSKVAHQLSRRLHLTIPQSSQNRGAMKATYNFFKNKKVHAEDLIATHLKVHQRENEELDQGRLLVAGDTTQLDFTGKRSGKQMGPLSYRNQRGLSLHSDLIISPHGAPIGLFKQQYIQRQDTHFGQAKKRATLPIQDKESYRWLSSYRAVEDYFESFPNLEIFHVMDREADIHELLQGRRVDHVHYLIRSKYNRLVVEQREGETQQQQAPALGVHDKVRACPKQGQCKVKVTDRRTGKQRTAQVSLRYTPAQVYIRHPKSHQKHLRPVDLYVLEAWEEQPPKGKKAVRWMLITSKKISALAEAKMLIRYYAYRWLIERFHYVLKQGAKVEQLQLSTPQRIKNAVATFSIVAVNLLRMTYFARVYPDRDIYHIGISQREHQALYQYVQAKIDPRIHFDEDDPPTVLEFTKLLARLGGYMDFSSQPFPGTKTLWRGISDFALILQAFDAFMSKN